MEPRTTARLGRLLAHKRVEKRRTCRFDSVGPQELNTIPLVEWPHARHLKPKDLPNQNRAQRVEETSLDRSKKNALNAFCHYTLHLRSFRARKRPATTRITSWRSHRSAEPVANAHIIDVIECSGESGRERRTHRIVNERTNANALSAISAIDASMLMTMLKPLVIASTPYCVDTSCRPISGSAVCRLTHTQRMGGGGKRKTWR